MKCISKVLSIPVEGTEGNYLPGDAPTMPQSRLTSKHLEIKMTNIDAHIICLNIYNL